MELVTDWKLVHDIFTRFAKIFGIFEVIQLHRLVYSY